ncbi:hypothetical protein [Lentilactobacillus otakiensis]|uniref:hypothetical protein n=1 Tax=Lentilactobacillus otakiensis TaxID=481720 RepID=UPI003D17B9B7
MTINEMLTEIESYQHKLNLADDYLFNIVEFDPAEIKAYRDHTAPESAYQATLKQIKRLYLLSLSPEELLNRIHDAQKAASLSDADAIKVMAIEDSKLADFKAGLLPTMNYLTALYALKANI